jgi:hypothetical protein
MPGLWRYGPPGGRMTEVVSSRLTWSKAIHALLGPGPALAVLFVALLIVLCVLVAA